MATAEAQKVSAEVAAKDQEYSRLQTESYRKERELTEARRRLADLKLEAERTRGRLESQAQQIATIEERLTAGRERVAGPGQPRDAVRARVGRAQRACAGTGAAKPSRPESASRPRRPSGNRLQQALRGREQDIEGCRQIVLRLLGEASTLKNQLAQVKEYLAGRGPRNGQDPEGRADRARGPRMAGGVEGGCLPANGERQTELESVGEQKRRAEAELADRRTRSTETRQRLDALRSDVLPHQGPQGLARRDPLAPRLHHRGRQAPLHGDGAGTGRRTARRSACWRISWKWNRPTRRPPRNSCTTNSNT